MENAHTRPFFYLKMEPLSLCFYEQLLVSGVFVITQKSKKFGQTGNITQIAKALKAVILKGQVYLIFLRKAPNN